MRRWPRRVAGGGVTILSLWKGFDLVWSIPGRIDNSAEWRSWIEKLSVSDVIYPIGIVGGILLGTSEWWRPRVSLWGKRMRPRQETQEIKLNGAISDLTPQAEKFKELEPLITRHRETLKPIRDPFRIWFLWNASGQQAVRADHEELVAHLDALKIPRPPSDAGRKTWFHYLVQLEVLCQAGELQEARSFYQEIAK